MAYLTYDEYEAFGGTLTEIEFEMAEFKARKMIDYWTDCRVQNMASVPEAVKRSMMQVISYEQTYGVDAQAAHPLLASFNTDGYSESYGSMTEQNSQAAAGLYNSVRNLLYGEKDDNGVPLLYRGVNT